MSKTPKVATNKKPTEYQEKVAARYALAGKAAVNFAEALMDVSKDHETPRFTPMQKQYLISAIATAMIEHKFNNDLWG